MDLSKDAGLMSKVACTILDNISTQLSQHCDLSGEEHK